MKSKFREKSQSKKRRNFVNTLLRMLYGSWQTQGEHANSTQKGPSVGIEPATFLL